MIHLVADTNIFRQDAKRKSAAFQKLAKLCTAGQVTLHMPYVIRAEFETYLLSEYSDPLKNAIARVKTASKAWGSHFQSEPSSVLKQLDTAASNAEAWIKGEFRAWCDRLNVSHSDIADHHGRNVMDAYFHGSSSFSSKKERKDIPDAFVFEALRDIANAVGELHFVSQDVHFRKVVSGIPGVTVWDSLDDFVLDELCQDALDEVNSAGLISALKENEELMLEFARKQLFDELCGYEFMSNSIPADNGEATIGMLDIPDDVDINWDEAESYGEGVVAVPFVFSMEIQAEFAIYKSDYYSLGEETLERISVSECNSHYFDAELEMSVNVSGRLAVSLDAARFDGSPGSIASQLSLQTVQVSEIEDVTADGD